MGIPNIHDRFFKEIFSHKTHARDFLSTYLPEKISKLLDLNTLSTCKESFIEKELKEYFSDVLYQVKLKDQTAWIYLLFEHKSYPEKLSSFYLLRYMVKIWGLLLKQQKTTKYFPIIIPLVIYHGESRWETDTRFIALFRLPDNNLKPYIPDFNYLLYDISHLNDEDIKGEVMLRIAFLTLKYIFNPELKEKLADIATANLDLFTKTAKDKNISLINSVPQDIYIYADFDTVNTVVRNLINNAIKFTKPGGIVEISAAEQEKFVEISVSDAGLGIEEEHLSEIFRVDSKYKTKGTAGESGTGLGLPLCKEFVEKNGGRIWVESKIGKGSTFKFILPKY